MNIDEMPAGHQFDVLIGTEVMGYSLNKWGEVEVLEDDSSAWPDWSPTTEMRDAWRVAKKLKIVAFPVESEYAACCIDETRQGAGISCTGGWIEGHIHCLAYAPTAELAICRCALKAKRGKQ